VTGLIYVVDGDDVDVEGRAEVFSRHRVARFSERVCRGRAMRARQLPFHCELPL